jgi:CDP-glycerol glycerophosphotransferase
MPTHRLNERKGTPFNGFEGFGFDQEAFFRVLEEQDYVFFNKGHFYDSGAQIGMSNPRFLNVTDKDFDNLYTFVKDMDILMTDFSSIYIDYLLVKKPIILAPFDYEDYITGERPLYFDYNDLEGTRANDWDEVLHILREHTYCTPSDAQISRFHRYIDGNSAQRIAKHIQES